MLAKAPDGPVRGFYDPRFQARIVNVPPGAHEVSDAPDEVLSTLLGSCVAACIRDRATGVGGVNHFLLPGDGSRADPASAGADLRFGVNAMEMLINALIRRGARRDRLEAKVFGGANLSIGASAHAVGERNAAFVQRFLDREGIPIARSDLGGRRPRRVNYHPASGKAWVIQIRDPRAAGVIEAESAYRSRIADHPGQADLEIFR